MTRKSNLLLVAIAVAGMVAGCGDTADDVDYTTLDREWDAADSAFLVDYDAVRTENERLEQEFRATSASADSAAAAQYSQAQQRLEANRQARQEMDRKRAEARAARDAARTAKSRASYDSARMGVDYTTWRTDLNRIRTEQKELEGTIKIGQKTVGTIDANVKDSSEPLLRVEPGKDDDKPLIRIEPGKDDDKPLIEKNKNP